MHYLLLIVEPVGQRGERGLEGGREAYASMLRYTEKLREQGLLVASNSLASTAEGVRLQMREGRRLLTDGPFAETKEMVGGFFLVDVADRAQALDLAAACPAAAWSTVEVRAVAPCYESS